MKTRFLNIRVDNLTMTEALAQICVLIGEKKNAYVVTPNVDHIVKLETDEKFQAVYRGADLVLTDGQPLIWISRLLKCPIKEKISGSDLFPKLCELAATHGYRMFFLGAAPGVADCAAKKLKEKYPGLQVTGTYSPPLGFEKKESEIAEICKRVRAASPDILITSLGTPKQEFFIYDYRDRLQVPISFGLGASLDFAAGNVKRAPGWMQKCGLEWFYRLCREPRRLFRRYLIDDPKILGIVWKYRKTGRKYEDNN